MSIPSVTRFALLVVLALFCFQVVAQQNDSTEKSSPSLPVTPAQSGVCIGDGDLLEISIFSVYGTPDVTEKVRVGNTGEVSLPFVGPIRLAGLTAEQAERTIVDRLRAEDLLKNPHVSVFIQEYATQGVSVMGEVNKPGVYPVVAPRRLLDIISAAGGLTPRAGRKVAVTRRDHPEAPIAVDVSDQADSTRSNVEILPGDTVVVSQAGIVYVIGEVHKPGGFVMDNNDSMTVVQAVAMAEGYKSTAAVDRAKIIRKTSQGMQETPLNLKKILNSTSLDMPLHNGDIVFVPSSAGKKTGYRALEAILQMATGVAVYRRY